MDIITDSDETARTIILSVRGAELMDRDGMFRPDRGRQFNPDKIKIDIFNGEIGRVSIHGGIILKSGATSGKVRGYKAWYAGDYFAEDAPEWVREVVKDVAGVTAWWTR